MPRIPPLVVSILFHLSAVAVAGAYLRSTSRPSAESSVISVDLVAAAQTPGSEPLPNSPVPEALSHRALRPRRVRVAVNRREQAPFAVAVPTAHFALSNAHPMQPLSGGLPAPGTVVPDGEVFPEPGVSVPARLLSSTPVSYPPQARAAEVELDVPLELVVDPVGRVVQARGLSRCGYGLDEAAVRAVRTYRFSPALRGGRPVAVRMRWTVQFRLR
jgi:protein TonB